MKKIKNKLSFHSSYKNISKSLNTLKKNFRGCCVWCLCGSLYIYIFIYSVLLTSNNWGLRS